jgi:CHAT domain-containing protein
LSNGLDARVARIAVALTEARVADAAGDPGQVLAVLEPLGSDLGRSDFASEWEVETLRARAHLRLGRLDSAKAAGREAVSMVERVRRNLSSGVLRTSFTSAKMQTYSDLVSVLLRLGETAEAFEVADAARGRSLSEHLAAADQQALALDEAATQLAEGEQLLRRIDLLVEALDQVELGAPGADDPSVADEVRDRMNRLTQARNEYEALLVSLAERDPNGAMLLHGGWTSAASVQSALEPSEALLEFMVTPDRLLAFVVTVDDIRIAESDITAEDLATRVRLARELLRSQEAGDVEARDVLTILHGTLIEPAVRAGALFDASRLIIVPHEALTYLPFAALRDGTTGRYLIEDFSLLHLPSAATLTVLRGEARTRRRSADRERPAFVLAPFPNELPATLREAEAVGASLPGAVEMIGNGATELLARKAFAQGDVVHLATHGLMNPRNPMFSRLELRRGVEGRSTDDGRLEVHELLGLAIASPLVFLSGCETGLGSAWSRQFTRGEDFATLASAFLYAGSDNVVATLWRLEDESAALFAETFYDELSRSSPVEALGRAQRSMIIHPEYASPYYWATYRLTGSGD